ncbi:hypothetical protein TRV_02620 [Trichophyton verrucosum HKI 0517]|uniref:Uncharacterized protein n=1 Tax=Trichophyton verrucosum (strain HKI 0517) TaxID=663202 RepID=D4D697_TRIVH|nr:uncharacterized protein TRV_02620 [Trichophyton verrucosum HKI 0517]EFE42668.1 hypothetical protein TRV_02620 [Trichophyton verrucosum HKI 0517]
MNERTKVREKEEKISSWRRLEACWLVFVDVPSLCQPSSFAGIPATPNHPNYAIRLHPGPAPGQGALLISWLSLQRVSLEDGRCSRRLNCVRRAAKTLVAVGGCSGRHRHYSQHSYQPLNIPASDSDAVSWAVLFGPSQPQTDSLLLQLGCLLAIIAADDAVYLFSSRRRSLCVVAD